MTHGIICSCSLSEDESFGERDDYNDDPPPCFGCRESMLDLHRQPLTPMERGSAPKSLTCKNLLPLLQTCRQIYTEAIPFLYNTTTFSASDIFTLLDFTTALPPPRLRHIHSLALACTTPLIIDHDDGLWNRLWGPPNDIETWLALWTAIGTTLPRLRILRISLFERGQWHAGDWESYVAPIGELVKGVEVRGVARYVKRAWVMGPLLVGDGEEEEGRVGPMLELRDWWMRFEVSARTGWELVWADVWEGKTEGSQGALLSGGE